MAKVQRLQQLVNVVPHVVIDELGVQASEVGVVDVLEDQRGRLALRVAHHVQQGHHVGPARQVLQDLDLALDLLLLDRLQHLDDALLVVDDVDALEDFRVLAATCRFLS